MGADGFRSREYYAARAAEQRREDSWCAQVGIETAVAARMVCAAVERWLPGNQLRSLSATPKAQGFYDADNVTCVCMLWHMQGSGSLRGCSRQQLVQIGWRCFKEVHFELCYSAPR